MTPLPEPSPDELDRITRLISEANSVADSAVDFSGQRLRICIEVGSLLIEWKARFKHGQWMKWAEGHLPGLEATARQRWMALAAKHKSGGLDITTARGLRQAYIMAGLMPGGSGSSKGSNAKPSYLTHLAKLVAALQGIEVTSLTLEQRATLRLRFEPVSQFVRQL